MNNLKNSKLLKTILIALPTAFVLLMGVAMAASTLFDGSPVPELERAFKLQMEVVTKAKEALCNTEVALAKAKLLDHYNGKQNQDDQTIARLTQKAKGEDLTCKGF